MFAVDCADPYLVVEAYSRTLLRLLLTTVSYWVCPCGPVRLYGLCCGLCSLRAILCFVLIVILYRMTDWALTTFPLVRQHIALDAYPAAWSSYFVISAFRVI